MFIISSKTLLEKTLNVSSDSAGTKTYATASDLPITGVEAGTHAYVESVQQFYVFTGAAWFMIPASNQAPVITQQGGDHMLATDGTPTEVVLDGNDPDGFPVIWEHSVNYGTQGNSAIAQNGNTFTITPSTIASDNGTFGVTFTATDGVDTASSISYFTLAFEPMGTTYGWWGGGQLNSVIVSSVFRLQYSTDTSTPLARGSLTSTHRDFGATGNDNYGWFAGGYGTYSIVSRVEYSTDSSVASSRGPLLLSKYDCAATGNMNYGWHGGGYPYSASVHRIQYSADTNSSVSRGPLSLARYGLGATGNMNYGWFFGGNTPGFVTTVDRITFGSDTATASIRGPLTSSGVGYDGMSNDNYGWVHGDSRSYAQRITYASDTTTTSIRGNFTTNIYYAESTGDTNYGYVGGGSPATSKIERVDYSADTTNYIITTAFPGTYGYSSAATGGYPG